MFLRSLWRCLMLNPSRRYAWLRTTHLSIFGIYFHPFLDFLIFTAVDKTPSLYALLGAFWQVVFGLAAIRFTKYLHLLAG